MLKNIIWFLAPAMMIWPSICPAAEAPHELAGFILGDGMAAHMQDVKPETILSVRHLESLKEVETKDIWGYKTGLISYTTCATPPRIVRIELKYADASKIFYDALLKRFKERFGEPDEYRGDPFHIFIAWKWSFRDKNGNDISLILQHNTLDEEERMGNVVKLTMWNLFKEEKRCFEKSHPQTTGSGGAHFEFHGDESVNWGLLIPH